MRLVSYEHVGWDDYKLTFEYHPWYLRLFGFKPWIIRYIGSCTVWHTLPEFHRCSTSTERWLSNIWTKIEYEELQAAGRRFKSKTFLQ